MKRQTIAEGLGLNEEFEILNEGKCRRCFEAEETVTVSDSMEMRIRQIQEEEMGISTEPSIYEKKLMLAGFEFGKIIVAQMEGRKKEILKSLDPDSISKIVKRVRRDIEDALERGATPRIHMGGAPKELIDKIKELGLDEFIDFSEED
jgi:hypothetical protein